MIFDFEGNSFILKMTKEADKKRNLLRPVPKLTVNFKNSPNKQCLKHKYSIRFSRTTFLRPSSGGGILKSRSHTAHIDSISHVNNLNVNQSLLSVKSLEHLSSQKSLKKLKIKPYYMPVSREADRGLTKEVNANNIKNVLILISFSFAFLNLPYLITWLVFIYQICSTKSEFALSTYLYVGLEVAEVFHILNYSVLFFIYCSPASIFRKKLMLLGKYTAINVQLNPCACN